MIPLTFEDLKVGAVYETAGRTVTETDVVGFAGLSGDFNALHTDAVFAGDTPYGERIAHGLLVLSIASGLVTRLPMSVDLQDNILGLLGITCRWTGPTLIGDTVHVRVTVKDKRETSKSDRGVVVFDRVVVKDDGSTVLDSEWTLLIRRRTSEGGPSGRD